MSSQAHTEPQNPRPTPASMPKRLPELRKPQARRKRPLTIAERVRIHRLKKKIAAIEIILARPEHVHKLVRYLLERTSKILFNELQKTAGSEVRTTVDYQSTVFDHTQLIRAEDIEDITRPRVRTPIWVRDRKLFEKFGKLLSVRRHKTATFDILFLQHYYLFNESYVDIYEEFRLSEERNTYHDVMCCSGCLCGHAAKILSPKYDPAVHGTRRLQELRDHLRELGYKWLNIAKPTTEYWRQLSLVRKQQNEKGREAAQYGSGVDPKQFENGKVACREVDQGQVEQWEREQLAEAERRWREQHDPDYWRQKRQSIADRKLQRAVELTIRGKFGALARHLLGPDWRKTLTQNPCNAPISISHCEQKSSANFRGNSYVVKKGEVFPDAA